MASIFDWSSTASANVACDGIACNTGMSPANTDNLFRSIMALIRGSFAAALQNFFAGTAPLPLANGGTGGTDATSALAGIGGLSSAYRDLPLYFKSAAFTFDNSERGGGIVFSGASPATGTINPFATTPINPGAVYVIHNGGTAALTISPSAGVSLFVNGAISSTNAVLALGANATLIQWSADIWTISGPGVS
jgi:hypothetical protein